MHVRSVTYSGSLGPAEPLVCLPLAADPAATPARLRSTIQKIKKMPLPFTAHRKSTKRRSICFTSGHIRRVLLVPTAKQIARAFFGGLLLIYFFPPACRGGFLLLYAQKKKKKCARSPAGGTQPNKSNTDMTLFHQGSHSAETRQAFD